MIPPEIAQALAAQFDASLIKQDVTRPTDGFKPRYVPITEIIKRLNAVLHGCWNFELIGNPYFLGQVVVVHGRLTVWYINTEGAKEHVLREQFGQCLMKTDQSGRPVDAGYDMKAAASDALKKCATMLGMALELYERDESAMQGLVQGGSEQQGSYPPASAYQNQGVQAWQIDSIRQTLKKVNVPEQQVCQLLQIQALEQMSEAQLGWCFQQYGGLRTSAA